MSVFESGRVELARILEDDINVESVDLLAFDQAADTIVLDITSGWASPDNQHDGAWELTRQLATFWSPDGDGPWNVNGYAPNFRLVNSGRPYTCPGDFMVRLATFNASRGDWEATCA